MAVFVEAALPSWGSEQESETGVCWKRQGRQSQPSLVRALVLVVVRNYVPRPVTPHEKLTGGHTRSLDE